MLTRRHRAQLFSKSAEAVAQAIKRLPRLKCVHLEGNEIGDRGAKAGMQAVVVARCLCGHLLLFDMFLVRPLQKPSRTTPSSRSFGFGTTRLATLECRLV